jgi:rhodanese-related sulfurtransferase
LTFYKVISGFVNNASQYKTGQGGQKTLLFFVNFHNITPLCYYIIYLISTKLLTARKVLRLVFIPLGKHRGRIKELPKNKEIITFCVSSVWAYKIQLILEAEGYNNVKILAGALAAWPFEIEA